MLSMSHLVKIKVKPGETILFPASCVNCGREAELGLTLYKRDAGLQRSIKVPLCNDCQQELRRKSAAEERLERIGFVVAAAFGLLFFVLVLLLLPANLSTWLKIIAAVILAAFIAMAVLGLFLRKSKQSARPEKLNIKNAARISEFSWRAMTFEFRDEQYAESVCRLNEPQIMEL
jgi:hypothetical protein